MDLYTLLKLELGYCIRIDKNDKGEHEYLCDTDDLIAMAKEVLGIIEKAENDNCGCISVSY